jgi:hypothetical protein
MNLFFERVNEWGDIAPKWANIIITLLVVGVVYLIFKS